MTFPSPYKIFVVFLIYCFVGTGMASPRTKPHAAAPKVAKIVFDPSNPVIRPGRSTTVKAIAVDQKNNPIKNAKIAWTAPPSADGLFSISKPLGSDDNAIVIVGLTPAGGGAPPTDVQISATSDGVSATLVLHYLPEHSDVNFTPASLDPP